MEEESQHIRIYTFPVTGSIPGVPGYWPAGSRITINEATKEVLHVWPELAAHEASPAHALSQAAETSVGQSEQREALREAGISSLTDVLKKMGG